MYNIVAWIYFWFGAIYFFRQKKVDVEINYRATNFLRQEGYVFI